MIGGRVTTPLAVEIDRSSPVPLYFQVAQAFEKAMAGTVIAQVGEVTAKPILAVAGIAGAVVVKSELSQLKAAWQAPLKDL